ncbi:arginine--tRNA ligase [Hugenholtzia roseola]|uniref:arginine--tRNA ligase n=1 Tax=Hugenholtzia roseola TaxID=1002 RepID=UPI000414D92B|nr:arginine--tRNA ligase [Hugenholtzia roseola]
MNIELQLQTALQTAFQSLYQLAIAPPALQAPRKDLACDYAITTFAYAKELRKNPEEVAQNVGLFLKENTEIVAEIEVIKGFLNITLSKAIWAKTLQTLAETDIFENIAPKNEKVMVEYSSPNTNKPLHLGHLRNNFLGYSVSQILKAAGFEVMMVNLVNDRGIHICKSMQAYLLEGKNQTPQELGIKGDKLVGDFYVRYDKIFKEQVQELIQKGNTQEEAEKKAPILLQAQDLLRKWEQNDPDTVALWERMNGWVYEGFAQTYQTIGVTFDKYYYESNTYLLGKDLVEEGLKSGLFFKKENGSVWIDLTAEGLDEKLLLRGDGTSVYITQDMGTADLKFKDFPMQKSIYVVGNEQDYHFKVLQLIMKKMGRSYADGIYHLSYGMVELPHGKMKSREGTVVDADDLIAEMVQIAKKGTEEAEFAKSEDLSIEQKQKLYQALALGALKYYLLRVEPKKKMLFNPEESIDFHGNSGVYIQFNHARIRSILRKAKAENIDFSAYLYQNLTELSSIEIELLKMLTQYAAKIEEAAQNYAPSVVANYLYEIAKTFSRFYSEHSVLGEKQEAKRAFRLALIQKVGQYLYNLGNLLGMEMPEKM